MVYRQNPKLSTLNPLRFLGGGRFSFQANNAYRNERSTATLNVPYYVTDDFEEHYSEGGEEGGLQ